MLNYLMGVDGSRDDKIRFLYKKDKRRCKLMDLEAIKRAQEGSADDIGNLIVENTQNMYRVAFGILKNEEEIYDAISNTTIIVFEKIFTLKNPEFFKTWLTRILINECYKIYNQNKKIIYFENDSQDNIGYNDTYSDLDVKDILKKLNPDFKEIVMLYYYEDYSVKEISKILDIPEGTVKSRLSRAREELSKKLKLDLELENKDISDERRG